MIIPCASKHVEIVSAILYNRNIYGITLYIFMFGCCELVTDNAQNGQQTFYDNISPNSS